MENVVSVENDYQVKPTEPFAHSMLDGDALIMT